MKGLTNAIKKVDIDSSLSTTSTNAVQNKVITEEINTIEGKIPTEASSSNQLADKNFVNSSIATNTATFRGTFTSLSELQATSGDANDYAFYSHTDSSGNAVYDRYKYVSSSWTYEYTLNNSSFTAQQWLAINSGATSSEISQIASNTSARHTHSNKALLDTYEQTEINLADAVSKKHEHSNKSILDGITASFTTEEKTKLGNIEAGAEQNVQSDWNESDSTKEDYIKNKPDLSAKEDVSNKTTSLTSSSTDTQYPSAKAVYDRTKVYLTIDSDGDICAVYE